MNIAFKFLSLSLRHHSEILIPHALPFDHVLKIIGQFLQTFSLRLRLLTKQIDFLLQVADLSVQLVFSIGRPSQFLSVGFQGLQYEVEHSVEILSTKVE